MAEGAIRAFVALPVPDGVREQLAPFLTACRHRAPGYRWVPPENAHVTLRFLGGLAPERLSRVRTCLGSVRAASFSLRLGEVGTFGGSRRPRVVWLGLAGGAEAAGALADAVRAACEAAGMEPDGDDAPFRAHLTVARWGKGAGRLPALPAPPAARWQADAFVLYQSRLGRPRATYVPLATYPLGGWPGYPA